MRNASHRGTHFLFQELSVILRPAGRDKALLARDDDAVIAARAMDDQDAAVLIPAADNANVLIVGIKGKVADLRILPSDGRAIAVLHGGTPAVTDDIFAACCVIEGPIHQ